LFDNLHYIGFRSFFKGKFFAVFIKEKKRIPYCFPVLISLELGHKKETSYAQRLIYSFIAGVNLVALFL